MASLAELYGQAATSYGKARAKARQIPANLRESGKGLASWAVDPYGEAQRVMGEYRNMTPEQRQGLVDAAVDLFGGVDVGPVGAIKASHGGPHLFDRFDFSKIGTGEGAQAYGHGGYFAQGFDSPTAKQKQKDLSNFYEPFLGERAGSELSNMDLDVLKALEIGKRNAGQFPHNTVYYAKKDAEGKPEILSALEDLPRDVKFGERFNKGHLYNVELKWPDAAREASDPLGEHHLLDWDAPLSQQPEHIRQALTQYAKNAKPFDIPIGHDPTGAELYGMISAPRSVGAYKTSEDLQSLGIPGIRYLDQASRGQGEGTRNYVMFDDRFPNIVTRNGVSITDLLKNR